MTAWLRLAFDRDVVVTATRIALIAGTLLNAINQSPQMLRGQGVDWPRLALTFLVPYVVSTVSAVQMKRKSSRERS